MQRWIKALLFSMVATLPTLLLAAATADAEEGKAVFMKRCKMCHGVDGRGNPAMARMLKVEFHPMDSEYVQALSDEAISTTVTKGKGKMAAVKGLTGDDISAVIAYIRSLGSK